MGEYCHVPDNKIPLTEKGEQQAHAAGATLAKIIDADESVLAFVSPYKRTTQTFNNIDAALGSRVKRVICEPNIREQDFGNFQDPEDMQISLQERRTFGRFFYRFPHGESGADVYTRAEAFISSLFRHM